MDKRTKLLFLSMFVSVYAMASNTSVNNSDGVEIWYDFDSSTKTASVTYQGDSYDSYIEYFGDIVIPSTVKYGGVEYSVTSIGNYAFGDCDALTSVTLPESLTSIGYDAFSNCDALTSIDVASNNANYTSVDGVLFNKDMTTLIQYPAGKDATSYTIPEGVTSIGERAFYECDALTSITLPEGLTSIGNAAFVYCPALTSITLPEGLTSIGNFAFEGCYKLYEVYNKSNLTITAGSTDNGHVAYYAKNVYTDSEGESKLKTVGDYIFYVDGEDIELIAYTGSETSITLPSDYEGKNYKIGDYAFYECDALTSITLPEGLTSIGDYAFYYCTALTSITLPEGLTSIGERAFYECDALTSITLPEGVTEIGVCAFSGALNLTEINVDGDNEKYTSEDGVLFNKDKTALMLFPQGKEASLYTIPESVDTIYQHAFIYNKTQTPITIPDGVTTIGDEAFFNSSFTEIKLPATVTDIGHHAFYSCFSLTSIDVAEGNKKYTSIDGVLFNNKKDSLIAYPAGKEASSYTIPSSVKQINENAFYECYNLESVYVLAETPPQIEWLSSTENINFYVPSESVEEYKSVDIWKDFAGRIQGINLSDISSKDDWTDFKDNGFFEALSGATINLKADISLSSEYGEVKLGSGVTLNGNGHTITLNGSSLFSSIGIGATVKNLVVTNTGGYANEKENFGIFACENNGTIESCAVEMSNAQLVTNVSTSTVGLLVGRNSGNINNCYVFLGKDASVTIINSSATAAGLVGKMEGGALKNCYVYCYDGSSIVDSEEIQFKVSPAVGSVRGDYPANNLYYCYTDAVNLAEGEPPVYATNIQTLAYSETSEGKFLNLTFTNPLKWETKSQNSGVWPGTPVLTYTGIEGEYIEKDGENIFEAEVNDAADMADLATLLSLRPDVFEGAIISLTEDIDYATADSAALDTLKRIGTAETPFNGTFDGGGHVIKNLKVNSDSDGSGAFFGVIGKDAEVKNLHFENVEVRVNEIKDEYIENDTIYLGIFADKLEGKLSKVSFVGNILIEENLATDKEVKLCFTSEGTDSAFIDHAFVYILDKQEEQRPDSNKACIVIKQHIGIGRRAKRTRKTCSNRRTRKVLTLDPDKDLSDEETADINSEYREFTDEEFMSGEVAYWLNYAGKGYTGEYIGDWTQGELYPIYQEDNANMLVKIVYTIEGNDDISFTAPTYANVGSVITMTYDEMPLSIKVDNLDISTASIGACETSITVPSTIEPIVNVVMSYYETSINDIYEGDVRVTSCDSQIKVEGAEGEMVRIVSLRGIEVMSKQAESDNMTIRLPQSGVYIVTVGDKSFKVACR